MMTSKNIEDIQEKYLKEIRIPDKKPSEQIFFCPVGLVGAGKTTFTKPIAERLNLIRISNDEIRKILKENGFDYSQLKKIGISIAEKFIRDGWGIAFDADCGNPETKQFIEKMAEKIHAKTYWVSINSPEDYILHKFKNHPSSWLADNPQIMIDNYYAQKEKRAKENTRFDFSYIFDASKNIPEQIESFLKSMHESKN